RPCPPVAYLTGSAPTPPLRSFPTRRSSDLTADATDLAGSPAAQGLSGAGHRIRPLCAERGQAGPGAGSPALPSGGLGHEAWRRRSEEHTSELQSRENLVCRPLLEKKNRPPR